MPYTKQGGSQSLVPVYAPLQAASLLLVVVAAQSLGLSRFVTPHYCGVLRESTANCCIMPSHCWRYHLQLNLIKQAYMEKLRKGV